MQSLGRVILGITGSIAAYKSALLVRLVIKAGYEVKVIMTPSATDFISALTISTLSQNDVHTDISNGDTWNDHVSLGLWGDVMIIAPCTATTLGKMANGIADNMLVATYLSAKCPVMIAPAMDLDMWKHGSTKSNIERLESYGNQIIPVGHGELASGLHGDGRMAEPEDILDILKQFSTAQQDLLGKNVLVTAGPTYEHIDPVRFIGSPSSGKMGIALAEECAQRGATVTLVQGPGTLLAKHPSVTTVKIKSAADMHQAVSKTYDDQDISIFAAAVADYTPSEYANQKIKKSGAGLTIQLKRTKDIAAAMGQRKSKSQLNIGFALETENELEYAKKKLAKKNFDLIVMNSLRDKGAGFAGDTNLVSIIDQDGHIEKYQLKSKKKVAQDIVNKIVAILKSK